MTQSVEKNNPVEILYVQDALCGWCYGLAPVIDKLRKYYDGTGLSITPVHGGLWPGDRARPMDDALVSHLHHGMPKVTAITGQVFGSAFHKNIVNNPLFVYDTEPAARAAIIVRACSPINELDYIKAIQIAFFENGMDPTQLDTFLPIVSNYGIKKDEFIKRFNSKQTIVETQRDFAQCAAWGMNIYPSFLCRINGRVEVIRVGSCSFSHMVKIMDNYRGKTRHPP